MTSPLFWLIGPRTPDGPGSRLAYRLPGALLVAAGLLLLASTRLPVWAMKLVAPQYPRGLHVRAHVDRLEGDVEEIDRLNHYIGMRPLEESAQLERQAAPYAIAGMALLLLAAVQVHTRWAAALALPALTFPLVFLADLAWWMRDAGLNLDPHAPLSRSIRPFVPPILGEGVVGQFRTIAWVEGGFWLQVAASALIVAALVLHRRAWKPLVDQAAAAPAREAAHASG